MAKKIVLVTIVLMFAASLFAARFLSKEDALKQVFPEADSIKEKSITLTDAQIAAINEKAAEKKEIIVKAEGEEKIEYTCYYGMKGKEKLGVAIIENQKGKWGIIEMIIVMDVKTGKVTDIAIMSSSEKRGRPIKRKSFLKQFFKKGAEDSMKIRKDIRGISGATISTKAVITAVKRAVTVYSVACLGEKK